MKTGTSAIGVNRPNFPAGLLPVYKSIMDGVAPSQTKYAVGQEPPSSILGEFPIETRRLAIRPVEERDAVCTGRLMKPSISQWTATWPPLASPEYVANRIKAAQQSRHEGAAVVLAI